VLGLGDALGLGGPWLRSAWPGGKGLVFSSGEQWNVLNATWLPTTFSCDRLTSASCSTEIIVPTAAVL
jgi:hypothetical protein